MRVELDEHVLLVGARGVHEGRHLGLLEGLLGVVPGDDVANALQLQRLPRRLVEHGGVLFGDPTCTFAWARGDRHRATSEHGDGEHRSRSVIRPPEPIASPLSCGRTRFVRLVTWNRPKLAEQRAAPARPAGRLPVPRRARPRDLRRQGQVDPQARRLALLQGPGAEQPGHAEMVASVEQRRVRRRRHEAEALLAEQSFIKQYRPRFNIRLRDDKSYPFIAISLDEDFPRVYFTRERHRREPRLLRPVLERQARARDARGARARSSCSAPAPAPSRAGAAAARAWTTTSSAARRPASATSPRRSTAQASTA